MGRLFKPHALLALLPLCWGLAAEPAAAQNTGQVTGIVREAKTNHAIANAQVFIRGTRMGSVTARDGRYLILNVPPGRHELRVEMIGYAQPQTTSVTVTAGATALRTSR